MDYHFDEIKSLRQKLSNKFIENQNWRYATKKFDASKKISEQDLETLKEAIRLSASSYGLQLYKVLIVENPEVRAKLQPASWGQSQIVDASHLFVFANITDVQESHIDDYIEKSISAKVLLGKVKAFLKIKTFPPNE